VRLLGDHHALDLVVGGLGHDLLRHEVFLAVIGPAVDDFLRVGFDAVFKSSGVTLAVAVDAGLAGLDACA
jgi:hypothetical protein